MQHKSGTALTWRDMELFILTMSVLRMRALFFEAGVQITIFSDAMTLQTPDHKHSSSFAAHLQQLIAYVGLYGTQPYVTDLCFVLAS